MTIPQLRQAIVAALIIFAASTAAAFNSGDRVQCTGDNVNVRSSTDTSSSTNIIGKENTGYLGTFQSGPTSSGGHQWYYVKWDNLSQAGYTADFVAAAPAALPDLVISALSVSSTSVGAGSTVTVSGTVTNNGPGSAGSSLTRIRLATSTTIQTSDPLLDSFTVSALGANQSTNFSRTVTIPSGTTAGSYYMGATANADSGVTESSSGLNNNQRTTPITVTTVQQLPDLVISALSVSSTSVAAGSTVTVSGTVTNNGPGSAGSSLTRIRLATSTTIQTSDPLLDSFTVSALGANQSTNFSRTVTIPSGTAAGSYYMGATANADSGVTESSAGLTNNQRTIPISVALNSSLLLSITPGTAQLDWGQKMTYSIRSLTVFTPQFQAQ